MQLFRTFCFVVTLVTLFALPAVGDDLEPLLKTLRSVGPKGAGNREAGPAWKKLVRADAGQLPVILAGLDDAGPLASNWNSAAGGNCRRGSSSNSYSIPAMPPGQDVWPTNGSAASIERHPSG